MRTNYSNKTQNKTVHKMQVKKQQQSTSKFINDLLNSDSEQDNQIEIDDDDLWIGSYQRDQPPPLLISKNENIKQNLQLQSNRIQKQIKYTSYKLDGHKLVQVQNGYQFNTLNLQEASIIRGDNQILERQLQTLKHQSTLQKNQLNRNILSLENQNKVLKRQLNLLKQQMQTKDNYYQQLQQNIHKKQKQIQRLSKKITNLQTQLQQSKQQSKSHYDYNSKKRTGQLSKYLSNMSNKIVYDTRRKQDKENNDNSQKIYAQITNYIVKRVEEFKDRLVQQRMSAVVENIIQQFMTEIVNINPITVSRTIAKIKPDCSPIRNHFKTTNDIDSSIQSRSGMLFRQTKHTQNTQQMGSRTPIKQQTKQKSDELRNLQKSLQKLRQMQKSYVSKTPTVVKDSYDSLDRSSVMGLDKSTRSKSRRKKIFE